MKKTRHLVLLLLLIISIFTFSFPGVVSAISLDDALKIADDGGLYVSCGEIGVRGFACILTTILKILLSLAFLVAIIFVVISGYRFITSQGNEQAVTKAKQNLTWAIIGIVLIFLAWILMSFILDLAKTGDPGAIVPEDPPIDAEPPPDLGPGSFTPPS